MPPETVRRALVVVDSRQAAWEQAGDLTQPLQAGLIDREHIHAELGELVLGRRPGRSDDQQITFSSRWDSPFKTPSPHGSRWRTPLG